MLRRGSLFRGFVYFIGILGAAAASIGNVGLHQARGEDHITLVETLPGDPPVNAEYTVLLYGEPVTFRWIPAGTFMMGSKKSDPLREDSETLHPVELTAGFWMAQIETTQAFYEAVTGHNPSEFAANDGMPEKWPVDTVSWDEAVLFCRLLNEEHPSGDSRVFRLPTEAEWEYAARSGDNSDGLSDLSRFAWSGEETGSGSTHEAAVKEPNRFGLYDMQGNLWEWCADGYSSFGTGKAVDPYFPGGARRGRIDRGGCWDSPKQHCRYAWRGIYEKDRKSRYVGFRIVFGRPLAE